LILKNQKTGPLVRSFAVLVRSSCGLLTVPGPDLQTLVELDVTHGREVNKISSPKETLEVGPHSPNPILALLHGGAHAYEDDDPDQLMDQFMEHYRLDQEEDDASRQDQEGPSQEEDNDVMMSFRKVDKRVVVQPPPQP
jgi:hypothetical protein